MLGSIDANTGDPSLGWDTDNFPMSIRDTTLVMLSVLRQGGLAPGGLNFDAKVRRESTDIEDLFIGHIGAMDSFARGLKNAHRLIEDGIMAKMLADRYASFGSGLGAKIEAGQATFEDCEEYVKKNGEPAKLSGKQESFEVVLNNYIQ